MNNVVKPFFSIVIPTLNEEYYLPLLLNDLANQTFNNFEVIVVDAESSDKTLEKAKNFEGKYPKISLITSKKRNVSHQRNLGAKSAISDWIVFMDADNRLSSYFLQGLKYRQELLNPDLLSTWIKPDSEDKKDKAAATFINVIIDVQKSTPTPYLLESMLLIKKGVFTKLGGFDETLTWGEGSDLLRRLIKNNYKFSFVKDPKYTFSLRRLRKQGTFNTFRNVAQIELARLANSEFSKKISRRLYPMEGGKYFEAEDQPLAKIESILSKVLRSDLSNLQQPNFLNKIKMYLTKVFQNKG